MNIRAALTFGLTLLWVAALHGALADGLARHPRVVELEDKITHDAMTFLRTRFPDRPFMVTVSLDPLRRVERETRPAGAKESEQLPFFDLSDEEIRDEWDDPQLSLASLMLRVRRAVVTVSLPTSISDDEANEVKTSLISYLHLTPARDDVQIVRKEWAHDNRMALFLGVGLSVILCVLIGLFMITRTSAHKIATAFRESKGGSSTSVTLTAPAPAPQAGNAAKAGDKGRLEGDFRFSDPIKIREIIGKSLDIAVHSEGFPDHHDMIRLEEFGKANPRSLGALLKEFPLAVQKRLFSLSSDTCWLEAFHRPGPLTLECLEVLHSLGHTVREGQDTEWKDLLLFVWRLGPKAAVFLREFKADESLTVLAGLPKNFSIPVARKVCPGTWGVLLDVAFRPAKMPPVRVREMAQRALVFKPLNDFSRLNDYQTEAELLDLLKVADIAEERDIYGAIPADSVIHTIRKPFFPVVDQSEEVLKALVQRVSVEDWSLALFNVAHDQRRLVDRFFTDRQKLMFIERLKQYDGNNPDRRVVGEARERVGVALCGLLEETPVKSESQAGRESDEKARAA